jgi:RNA polymerase-binding transcription factor DksA
MTIDIEQQKKRLEEMLAEVVEELNTIGVQTKDGDWMVRPEPGDGDTADPVDNADITEEFEESIAVLKVLEERHAQIQKALAAIENGSYGIDEETGEKIPEERLRVNPAATTAV